MVKCILPLCLSTLLVWTCRPCAGQEVGEQISRASEAQAGLDEKRARGQQIYQQSCAACHGERGEGVAEAHAEPLVGDASLGELTQLIARTMPEGEPDQCVGPDAEAVALYIHESFYSEAARLRNRPPRISLARLTANQLRQSLADLYAHSTGSMWLGAEPGITGQYYDGARFRRENRKLERVDATIDFDFKNEGPGEGIKPEDFAIHWRGGLKVDRTGEYEIVIHSTCAFMCYLGRYDREFINNRVQSGDRTEFRKSVVLTAGRVHPIQIELYQRKRKTEQPPVRIRLSWVPPGGVERVIPSQNLLAASAPATFSLQTRLPPDDRSYGYERGIAVDRQWDDSTTAAAIEFAGIAVAELWPDYRRKHRDTADDNRAQLRAFLAELVELAFRGPLDDEARQLYVQGPVDLEEDDAEAIRRCLLSALKSPRFLYPALDGDRSVSQRVANRLALTMFDSLPADKWLLELIRDNQLETEDQIRAAARKMVGDYRTRGKTRELMYEWLNLSHLGEITKNAEKFPDFDEQLVADLQWSFDAFLDEVIWSEHSDYRQLFEADWSYTTQRLAEFYGASWERKDQTRSGLSQSVSDGEHRVGLLSHPYLMSGLAYQDSTSPIHRGVFLIRYMLGRTLRPPQEAFTPLSPDLHPDLTTRQRVQLQTSPQGCQVCHSRINGLGFTLENFDAVGRFRQNEYGKSIDSSGFYLDRDGRRVEFSGPRDLAKYLSDSQEAQSAFVNRAFQHFVKQPVAAFGIDRQQLLTERFREHGFRIRDLLVEIAVTAALQTVPSSEPAEPQDKDLENGT